MVAINATIINLTPHVVNLMGDDGKSIATFEPSGQIARAKQIDRKVGSIEVNDGVFADVVTTEFGDLTDLPATQPGKRIFYIVSVVTANAAKAAGLSTHDLLVTSGPVRDETGRIIGCRRFARI